MLWDFGYADMFADLDFLMAALVLTRVVSKPGVNRLCLDLGHKAIAAENPPKILRHKSSRQTEAEKRRMTELENRRNLRATELDLDPTLIASRAMLVMLARDWTAHEKGLMSWQKQLLVDA